MSDETPDKPDEITPEDVQDTPEQDEPDEWTPPDKVAWQKLQDKAKRREEKLREAQAELAKLKGEGERPSEPSPEDTLRNGLIRTTGRAVLAGAGITDRKAQGEILDAIRLDGIEVDEAGEVDSEELESRIGRLRELLAAPAPSRKVPARVDTRDKGGRNAEPTDPDAARYARIGGWSRI